MLKPWPSPCVHTAPDRAPVRLATVLRHGVNTMARGIGFLPEGPAQVQGKHSPLPPKRRATMRGHQQPRGRSIMEPPPAPNEMSCELADDILRGADAIAEFIFGARESRRKVYYLAECCRLPVFRLGAVLCARRSVLLNWIAGQESRVTPPSN